MTLRVAGTPDATYAANGSPVAVLVKAPFAVLLAWIGCPTLCSPGVSDFAGFPGVEDGFGVPDVVFVSGISGPRSQPETTARSMTAMQAMRAPRSERVSRCRRSFITAVPHFVFLWKATKQQSPRALPGFRCAGRRPCRLSAAPFPGMPTESGFRWLIGRYQVHGINGRAGSRGASLNGGRPRRQQSPLDSPQQTRGIESFVEHASSSFVRSSRSSPPSRA